MSGGGGRVVKLGRGTPLKSQSKILVARLREYFTKEKQNEGPFLSLNQVNQRVADALGIGRSTVSKIHNEEEVTTPGRKRPREAPITNIDNFDGDAIRNHIYDYFTRKELPTRAKLVRSLAQAQLYSGGRSSLSKVLFKVGFKWKNINNRRFLMERYDIVNWRIKFLRKILKKDISKLVFLDEICVNAGKTWNGDSVKTPKKENLSKGGRLIVTHAGTTKGFVRVSPLLSRSKKPGDFEMDPQTFKEWFIKLLKKLEPGSTIIMDNAPCRSNLIEVFPSSISTKAEIMEWLKKKTIDFDLKLRKAELLTIVKSVKDNFKQYELDKIAAEYGHEVLRQPPYHCTFNAIDLIWTQVKNELSRKKKSFKLEELERLTLEAVKHVTKEHWEVAVESVISVMTEAWEREVVIEQSVDSLIDVVRNGTMSSSDEDDLDDEDFELACDEAVTTKGRDLQKTNSKRKFEDDNEEATSSSDVGCDSDECDTTSSRWSSKFKELEEDQMVLADVLITMVFAQAHFKGLTPQTKLCDFKIG